MPKNHDEFIKKRVERQKKIRRRRLKILLVFLLVLALLIGAVLSLTVFFKIKNVTADGAGIYSGAEIVKAADISPEQNLFLISENEVLPKIKQELPYVEGVEFERILPDTLNISVTYATEFYCIFADDVYYTVSEMGYVLKTATEPNENLILVKGCEFEASVGSKIKFVNEEDYELVYELHSLLKKQEIKLQYIDLSNRADILLGVDNRFTVRLGAYINVDGKIKQLAAIIEQIPEVQKGTINLSMWSLDNKKGTFVAENQ